MLQDEGADAGIWAAAREGTRFFMGEAKVDLALEAVTKLLDQEGIPYCLVGAMALNLHGYRRFTEDIDLLDTRAGHAAFKRRGLGRGYAEKFPGSKTLRDTVNNVTIDFLLTGEFPGDGKPKPVVFPDPAVAGQKVGRLSLMPLPGLVDLKLASGMSAPHRIKDLADVLELVRAARLPLELEQSLDPSVREKFRELWNAAQGSSGFRCSSSDRPESMAGPTRASTGRAATARRERPGSRAHPLRDRAGRYADLLVAEAGAHQRRAEHVDAAQGRLSPDVAAKRSASFKAARERLGQFLKSL